MSYHHKRDKSRSAVESWGGADMRKKGIDAILVSVLLLFALSAAAAGIPEKKPEAWGEEQGDEIPLIDQGKAQIIDNAQVDATVLLYDVAEYIDSFFDDGRYTSEENESRATVKLKFPRNQIVSNRNRC
ncbi:MAG: hypothetical protein ACI8PB_003962 [Desulforhopalus sp.]|jgi:hypothetical protein